MFRKLYKNIFNSLFWLAFAFVVLLSAVSGIVVLRNLYNVYDSLSESSVRQATMDGNNTLASVVNFARSTAQNSEVVLSLTENKTDNVSKVLATLVNSSSEIAGAILYGEQGQLFYSSGVGDVPTLSQLRQNAQLNEFFQSDNAYAILLRDEAMPSVYNQVSYDTSQGVISCVCKVYDEQSTVGYLFADVLPQSLFAKVLSTAGTSGTTVALVTPTTSLSSQPMPKQNRLRNLYFDLPFAGGGDFVFCLSLKEYYTKCLVILAVLFTVDALCIVCSALVARHVAQKVTMPLDKLRQTMQNENLLN